MTDVDLIDAAARIERLADQLAADGYLTDPLWRSALLAVPRHVFIPDAIWDDVDTLVLRPDDPVDWFDLIYRDELIIHPTR